MAGPENACRGQRGTLEMFGFGGDPRGRLRPSRRTLTPDDSRSEHGAGQEPGVGVGGGSGRSLSRLPRGGCREASSPADEKREVCGAEA